MNKPTDKMSDATKKMNEATDKMDEATDKMDEATDKISDATDKMGDATDKMGDATDKMDEATDKISDADRIAHYDYLTEIPNRSNFDETLVKTVENAKRHNRITCVLFLDLDNFKNINDTFGHEAGDTLLKQISKRLQSVMRKEDMLARLSGDEFAISMKEIIKAEDAEILAKKLIHVLQEPFSLSNKEVIVTLSIGIA